MNYSHHQQYPPYQRNPYENQPQPCWNDVDVAVPTTAPFEASPQFHSYPGEYHDGASLLPSNEHNAPSPNYSQYLNFESMDTGPVDAPENAIPPQATFNTSPTLTTQPQQYAGFPIKIEPESEPAELPFSRGPNAQQADYNSFPRTCGAAPSCLQILENPDMEMEDFKNMGDWFPSSTTASALDEQPPRRRPSHTVSGRSSESSGRKPSTGGASTSPSTGSRKPRKRGRKPSTIDPDDEEAQARAKQAHSIVERRYRDNLNAKIMQLHHTLSSIASTSKPNALHSSPTFADEDMQEQSAAPTTSTRVRKSDVMTDAVNYVHQSEVSMRHMTDEINRLTERVRALEKLVRCEDCVLLKEMVRRSIQGPDRTARPHGQIQQ